MLAYIYIYIAYMDIHGTYGYVICQRWTISISYFLWHFFLDIFHMVDTLAHVHGSSEDRGTSVFQNNFDAKMCNTVPSGYV